MAPSLHQSLLMVSDLDASVAFYRDVIGLDVSQKKESNVEFETGESTLVLEEDFPDDVLEDFGLPHPGEDRGNGVIVVLDVDTPEHVDDTIERIGDAGYEIRMEPRDVPWGRRMALVADPDRYTVEISAPQ